MRRTNVCHIAMKQEHEFYTGRLYIGGNIHGQTHAKTSVCMLARDCKLNLSKRHKRKLGSTHFRFNMQDQLFLSLYPISTLVKHTRLLVSRQKGFTIREFIRTVDVQHVAGDRLYICNYRLITKFVSNGDNVSRLKVAKKYPRYFS
ncbi:uncharacterized protein LOC143428912 [Xylocopa sonorina]|uniref:uncharacterized protein LOC143428912 n=1 Tax=Xylocopa sonorina TaxID=1818115 RepID=UPI00403AC389